MKTLIIDNYDSMTFNLFQYVSEVNDCEPLVLRNDEAVWEEIAALNVDNIIISPGPGSPERDEDFGVSKTIIQTANVPVLGVCLGHQGIGHLYGARVTHATEPMHGRMSLIQHTGTELFAGLPSPMLVVRYHSLILDCNLPATLEKQAWTEDDLVMAVRVKSRPIWGVQFHPESIGTEHGKAMLQNFKNLTMTATRGYSAIRTLLTRSRRRVAQEPCLATHKEASGTLQRLIVRSRRLPFALDCEAAFAALYAHSNTAFWLDSSLVAENLSRFSFLGDASGYIAQVIIYRAAEHKIIVRRHNATHIHSGDIFSYLRGRVNETATEGDEVLPFDFTGGFVGYLGYEVHQVCGTSARGAVHTPDAAFIKPERFIAVDHIKNQTWLVHVGPPEATAVAKQWFDATAARIDALSERALTRSPPLVTAVRFRLRHDEQTYQQNIQICQQQLRDGESYQICLTNEIVTEVRPDPFKVYRVLRHINPAPYSAFLKLPGTVVMCSSPERFLKIRRHGLIEAKPIKGTIRRGRSKQEDQLLREWLRLNEKERSENLMIIDLLRNDLGRVCEANSVAVPKLMAIESYATVHQMVSTVTGQLQAEVSPVDAVRVAFPGGSMTGTPKLRTLNIIDRLEARPRGIYSGALGFFGFNGSVDLNIVIRTIVADLSHLSIGCGGAITVLSDPRQEFEEIMLKARAPMQAVAIAATGRADAYFVEGLHPESPKLAGYVPAWLTN